MSPVRDLRHLPDCGSSAFRPRTADQGTAARHLRTADCAAPVSLSRGPDPPLPESRAPADRAANRLAGRIQRLQSADLARPPWTDPAWSGSWQETRAVKHEAWRLHSAGRITVAIYRACPGRPRTWPPRAWPPAALQERV